MAAVPATLKPINSYLKLAKEYDKRDPTVAYFCRMYAIQRGIKLESKSPECKTFLFRLMDQLEQVKKTLLANGDEAVGNEVVAQAHVESITINLFTWADTEDRKGVFNKHVIKAFYSSSLLYDVISQFDEISEECKVQQKYAKWKATYLHKCMQTGETPIPGPEGSGFEDDLNALGAIPSNSFGAMNLNTNQEEPGYPQNNSMPYPPGPSQPNEPFLYTQPPQEKPIPKPRQPAESIIPASSFSNPPQSSSSGSIDFALATKFCKFAISAIDYEDTDSALDNLNKAMKALGR